MVVLTLYSGAELTINKYETTLMYKFECTYLLLIMIT